MKTTSQNNKIVCVECKNTFNLPNNSKLGMVIECDFCGIEYQISNIFEDKNVELKIVEAAK